MHAATLTVQPQIMDISSLLSLETYKWGDRSRHGGFTPLQALAVVLRNFELIQIHVVQAASIDSNHRGAIGTRAAREGFYAANPAEEVVNMALVELILGQRLLPREQREFLCGHEGQQRAGSSTHGTIAADDRSAQIELYIVTNLAAVTAASITFDFAHEQVLSPPRVDV